VTIDNYRKTFEGFLGKQTNFLQWTRYSSEFLATGLPLNTNNLKLFARFKQKCPRKTLDKSVLNALKSFQNRHRSKADWLGLEIEIAIRELNPIIPEWQIYRAFYRAGLSFKFNQSYEQKQVYDVVFYALIYGGNSNERVAC
jgi:hypothetical protein